MAKKRQPRVERYKAMVQNLIREHGDIKLSAALALLGEKRDVGRPQMWDEFLHRLCFALVQSLIEKGVTKTSACRAIAHSKFFGVGLSAIEKRYAEGLKLFGGKAVFQGNHLDDYLQFHIDCNSLITKTLATVKVPPSRTAYKTRAIRR